MPISKLCESVRATVVWTDQHWGTTGGYQCGSDVTPAKEVIIGFKTTMAPRQGVDATVRSVILELKSIIHWKTSKECTEAFSWSLSRPTDFRRSLVYQPSHSENACASPNYFQGWLPRCFCVRNNATGRVQFHHLKSLFESLCCTFLWLHAYKHINVASICTNFRIWFGTHWTAKHFNSHVCHCSNIERVK